VVFSQDGTAPLSLPQVRHLAGRRTRTISKFSRLPVLSNFTSTLTYSSDNKVSKQKEHESINFRLWVFESYYLISNVNLKWYNYEPWLGKPQAQPTTHLYFVVGVKIPELVWLRLPQLQDHCINKQPRPRRRCFDSGTFPQLPARGVAVACLLADGARPVRAHSLTVHSRRRRPHQATAVVKVDDFVIRPDDTRCNRALMCMVPSTWDRSNLAEISARWSYLVCNITNKSHETVSLKHWRPSYTRTTRRSHKYPRAL